MNWLFRLFQKSKPEVLHPIFGTDEQCLAYLKMQIRTNHMLWSMALESQIAQYEKLLKETRKHLL